MGGEFGRWPAALALGLLAVASPCGAWNGAVVVGPQPYPYPAPYPWYPWPVAPYPVVVWPETPPPAGWDAGHWEARQDGRGRSYQVWVPTHLR